MSKSIETIWQEGFINENALIAPKINDLYNQKSQNIVDKLARLFLFNIIAIAVGAIVMLVVMSVLGLPFLGLFITTLLLLSVWLGKKQLNTLSDIDKQSSSYQYIRAFNHWLKTLIQQYTMIYRFVYPAIFLACIIRFGLSNVGESIISGFKLDFPNTPLVFEMPVIFVLVITCIAFLLSYFAGAIYQLDMKPIYGREFAKLDEIIADMEALQND